VSEILTDALHSDKPFDPNDEELICGHIRCFTTDGEISRETFLRETANRDIGNIEWLYRGINTPDGVADARARESAESQKKGAKYAIDLPNPTHGFLLDFAKAVTNCYLVETAILRSTRKQTVEFLEALRENGTKHKVNPCGHSFGGFILYNLLSQSEFREGGKYFSTIGQVTTYGAFGVCPGTNYVATLDWVPWTNLRNWMEYYNPNSDCKIIMLSREPGSSLFPHDFDGPTYRHARELSRKEAN
jgi:hypothetical protein